MNSHKMAHRTVRSVFALLFICLISPPSIAQNESFKAAEKIPVNIHSVMSGGYWSAGKDEGSFRAVVTAGGVEHVVHRLYIQWLRNDAKTQGYELVHTVNIKELNQGHGYVMDIKASFGDINSFKIDVTAHTRGGDTEHYAIVAKGNGKYSISTPGPKLTNKAQMICKNPQRRYEVKFDDVANSFRAGSAGRGTLYQVESVEKDGNILVVRGKTSNGGPGFAAFFGGKKRIEFTDGGELFQTDMCK